MGVELVRQGELLAIGDPAREETVNDVLGCSKHGPDPTDMRVEDAMTTMSTHHGDAQVSLRKV